MPRKRAIVDYNLCRPDLCSSAGDGICAAAAACPHKLLKQEEAHEPPMPDPSLCRGCATCVLACPLKAVKIV